MVYQINKVMEEFKESSKCNTLRRSNRSRSRRNKTKQELMLVKVALKQNLNDGNKLNPLQHGLKRSPWMTS